MNERNITAEAIKAARVNETINALFIQNSVYIGAHFRDKELISEAYMIATAKTDINADNFLAKFGGIYKMQRRLHDIYAPIVIDIADILAAEPEPDEEGPEADNIAPLKKPTKRQLDKFFK